MYFLAENYIRLSKEIRPQQSFCFVIGVSRPTMYGHKSAEIVENIGSVVLNVK